jgi:hypothetical protein
MRVCVPKPTKRKEKRFACCEEMAAAGAAEGKNRKSCTPEHTHITKKFTSRRFFVIILNEEPL